MKSRAIALAVVMLGVCFAPILSPYDPTETKFTTLAPPSSEHLLGTDLLGRDILSRALHGAPHTLGIGITAASAAFILGIIGGIISTSHSWVVRTATEAIINTTLAFPGLALALIVLTLLGGSTQSIIVAAATAQIAPTIRVIRAALLQVQTQDYMMAAKSLGGSRMWQTRYYLLPNILPTLTAYFGVVFSYCLLNSAALSFLGLNGDPSQADWGTMLYEGRAAFRSAPLAAFIPGMGITLSILFVQWAARGISDPRE